MMVHVSENFNRVGDGKYENKLGHVIEHLDSGLWQLRVLGVAIITKSLKRECVAYSRKVAKHGLMNI